MGSEWRHRVDVDWHLDRTDAMVRRSIDMLSSSRRALDELQQIQATTRGQLTASWALLTARQPNTLPGKSTVPETST